MPGVRFDPNASSTSSRYMEALFALVLDIDSDDRAAYGWQEL